MCGRLMTQLSIRRKKILMPGRTGNYNLAIPLGAPGDSIVNANECASVTLFKKETFEFFLNWELRTLATKIEPVSQDWCITRTFHQRINIILRSICNIWPDE